MTLTTSRDMSRRQLLDKAGIAAASVLAISLSGPAQAAPPPQASAPPPNSLEPDRRARVAEQWEDVLLLEALRYLGLSNTQIQAMLLLAKAADERMAKLREQEEQKLAVLEPLLQQHREALLAGKPVAHESDAFLHWRFLQQRRKQVEEEIIQYVAPRLARLLSRQQVLRAYLLARGRAVPAQVNSAALLEPSSGFLVDDATKTRWRDAVIKMQLARLYPPAVLNADPDAFPQHSFNAAGELIGPPVTAEEQAVIEARGKKGDLQDAWEARWNDLPGMAGEAETEDERVAALYHFVWRTFLSSRLTPVLTMRAGQ